MNSKTILNLPSEDEIIQAIFDSVDIRGINLEDYRYKFTNKESGLYDRLVDLFSKSVGDAFEINIPIKSSNHWESKCYSVIFVEKQEDIEPLYQALCKQDNYWEYDHKEIIQRKYLAHLQFSWPPEKRAFLFLCHAELWIRL